MIQDSDYSLNCLAKTGRLWSLNPVTHVETPANASSFHAHLNNQKQAGSYDTGNSQRYGKCRHDLSGGNDVLPHLRAA